MTDESKVVSLKFVTADGSPVDYVMIEGEDIEFAKGPASQWAKQNVAEPFESIEKHQGVMNAPDDSEFDVLDGIRVWHLPF